MCVCVQNIGRNALDDEQLRDPLGRKFAKVKEYPGYLPSRGSVEEFPLDVGYKRALRARLGLRRRRSCVRWYGCFSMVLLLLLLLDDDNTLALGEVAEPAVCCLSYKCLKFKLIEIVAAEVV